MVQKITKEHVKLEQKNKVLEQTNAMLKTTVDATVTKASELAQRNQQLKGTINQFDSAERDLTTKVHPSTASLRSSPHKQQIPFSHTYLPFLLQHSVHL
jgi:hypothetical protein